MRSILSASCLLVLSWGAALAADLDAIRAAIDAGRVAEVLPQLEAAAASGETAATSLLAELYQRGEGVAKNPARAIKLYREAASHGDAAAQFNLGNIYLLGEGVAVDEAWALTYYRQAAAQGHELATRNMNQLYRAAGLEPPPLPLAGTAEPDAESRARAGAEPAVAEVAPVAAEALAPTTRLGGGAAGATAAASVGAPRATGEARSAAVTNAPAIEAQVEARPPPVEQPAAALEQAAVAEAAEISDDEREAIRLAKEHGVDVAMDDPPSAPAALPRVAPETVALREAVARAADDESAALDNVAALVENGNAAAAYELARRHLAGQGTEQDVTSAVKLLQRAAKGGHAEAQFDLARRYQLGAGVPPDDAMAITLLREAARGGHTRAREQLTAIYTEAGLPMPDLQRPRQPLQPQRLASDAALPGGETTPATRLSESEPAVLPQPLSPPAPAHTPAVAAEVIPAPVVPADATQPDYVEPRYEYAIVEHDETGIPAVDVNELNPPRPDNHVVVAGGTLALSTAPPPVPQPPSNGLSTAEMLAEPELAGSADGAVMAQAVSPDPAAAVVAVAQPAAAPETPAPPPTVAPVATRGAAPARQVVAEAETEAEVMAEPEPDVVAGIDDAVAPAASATVGAGLDARAAAPSVSATADAAVQPARRGFFDKLRDALVSDEQPVVSRAPGATVASHAAQASAARQDNDLKLVIAQQAEPDPIIEKPTLEQAKAALNAGDLAAAAEMFSVLAHDGNAEAQAHIGYMTYQGEGLTRDKAAAVTWYRKSAVQGNRDAQYNLAVAYAFGEGVPQDDGEAVVWYRRAAEQGSAVAQYSLGVSYALGEGVEQSDAEAASWYHAAAEQGYPAAQYNLAYMYRAGSGLEQSDQQALRWYMQAAQNGHASAQYSLGYMYRSGKGVARNIDEAIRWYRLAAAQGHPEARADLSSLVPDS